MGGTSAGVAAPPRTLGARVAELAGVPHRPGTRRSPCASPLRHREFDVVVVGSGAAALSAAAAAVGEGAAVAIVEKGPVPGGTTALSGGVAHIYDNAVMRVAGIADPRPEALAYMARVAYPATYDPDSPTLGLLPDDLAQLGAYYDRGAPAVAALAALGAVRMEAPWLAWDGQMFPDYYDFAENAAPRGRGVQAVAADGGAGNGAELVRQLLAYCTGGGAEVLLGHRVVDLVHGGDRVSGIMVDDGTRTWAVGARGGVVFGTGGFTHDPELRARLLRGPVVGGSGAPGNTGDLLPIAAAAGVVFGGTQNAWWDQVVLESADDYANTVLDVWSAPGDGMVMVNRFGRRVVDEKREYQTRGGRTTALRATSTPTGSCSWSTTSGRRCASAVATRSRRRGRWPSTWSPAPGWPAWPGPSRTACAPGRGACRPASPRSGWPPTSPPASKRH